MVAVPVKRIQVYSINNHNSVRGFRAYHRSRPDQKQKSIIPEKELFLESYQTQVLTEGQITLVEVLLGIGVDWKHIDSLTLIDPN